MSAPETFVEKLCLQLLAQNNPASQQMAAQPQMPMQQMPPMMPPGGFGPQMAAPPYGPPQWRGQRPTARNNPNCFTCNVDKNFCTCGKYVNGKWAGPYQPQPPPPAQPAPPPIPTALGQKLDQLLAAMPPPQQQQQQQQQLTTQVQPEEAPPQWATQLLDAQKNITEQLEHHNTKFIQIGNIFDQISSNHNGLAQEFKAFKQEMTAWWPQHEQPPHLKEGKSKQVCALQKKVEGLEASISQVLARLPQPSRRTIHKRTTAGAARAAQLTHQAADDGKDDEVVGLAEVGPEAGSPPVGPQVTPATVAGAGKQGAGKASTAK